MSMTAVSTLAALVMTPFNITFWGSMHPSTKAILSEVKMDTMEVVGLIFMLVFIPVASGLTLNAWKPELTAKLRIYFKRGSIIFFLIFVVILVVKNIEIITEYMHFAILAVIIHNLTALSFGYLMAKSFKLPEADCRTVCIEVGIQNSALGLSIIFASFAGLGGLVLVAGLWGTWHLITGLSLAFFWAKRDPSQNDTMEQAA